MAPRAGDVLKDRYELTERIAIGGMGEVWRARDRTLERPVAVKVLREDLRGNETALARLRAEARNGAGLSHPNVATLIDYGERDGSGFLVMEFVAGEPLSDLLGRESALPVRDTLRILAQCAAGLHAAHVAGVVHRDVKPSNILLTPEGTVKLTDFGISLGAGQPALTAAGMVMGTAQYLPPELALGKKASPAGDIYALGVVGYEALVGRRPFTGGTQVEIAFAHVEQPVPALPEHIPAPVRDLVIAMLAKDPADRPRSAATLARAAEELLSGTLTVEVEVTAPRGPSSPDTARGDDVRSLAPDAPAVPSPVGHLADDVARPVPDRSGFSPDRSSHATSALPDRPARPSRSAGAHVPGRPPYPSRRETHRAQSAQPEHPPIWRDLAADRRWLTAVGIGVVIVIVLAAVLIGTLAPSDASPAGTARHLTIDQPSN